jgi:hypothetical protein
MRKLLERIGKALHFCNFKKPIASRYVSFHTRDIVFECKCGKRRVNRVRRAFSSPFPIETTLGITNKEFTQILAGKSIKEARGY